MVSIESYWKEQSIIHLNPLEVGHNYSSNPIKLFCRTATSLWKVISFFFLRKKAERFISGIISDFCVNFIHPKDFIIRADFPTNAIFSLNEFI